ncbi:MAG: HAD-IB family hydrolase [Gallionella sp.]
MTQSPFDKLRANELDNDKPVVAAFDFDGTLTRRETLLAFLLHTLGAARVAYDGLVLSPTLAGYGLGLIPNDVAKQRVFVQCLGGMRMDELEKHGEQFAQQILPGLMRKEAMQRLAWHQQQGHRCVVISASMTLYVSPWAIKAGFEDILATNLETHADGTTTGKLAGENCYGIEKVRRLEALLGKREGYTLYAYGDSRGDKEMLALGDFGYYREMPE